MTVSVQTHTLVIDSLYQNQGHVYPCTEYLIILFTYVGFLDEQLPLKYSVCPYGVIQYCNYFSQFHMFQEQHGCRLSSML